MLSTATSDASSTAVSGTLNSTPSTAGFRVELFSSPACDPSGYGEGRTFLGSVIIGTDSGGVATFSTTLGTAVEIGHVISATATDPNGNTSEFSACASVTLSNVAPAVTASGGSTTYTENAAPAAVDAGLVVSDADSTSLGSATVEISAGFQSGADVLAFTNTASITGSWNGATGKLTLSGSASVADYQAALRTVTYSNSSDAPSTAARTATFTVTDSNGATSAGATKAIAVTAVNDAPTDIALTSSSVAENQPSGTTVGTILATDPDAGDSFTYSLVSGTGDTDNASFSITLGDTLTTAASFNFETKASYSIRVRATDFDGLNTEKALTVTVTNVNEAPTAIGLSASTVPENQSIGTVVGTLSTTDPDVGDAFTYTLVSGGGSFDNAKFTIDGASLKTAVVFDFETAGGLVIRVRSTDGGASYVESNFTISISPVNEAPSNIALGTSTVAENQPSGTFVGTLSATDVDEVRIPETFTYSLVSGAGDTDNASFTIDGDSLKTASTFNFEAKSSYSIRIRVTDSGTLSFDKSFTIGVSDVNEDPTDISLSASSVAENQDVGTTVGTLTTTDPDAGDTFTYTLVTGIGDTDNASFSILGNNLKTAAVFNYESKSSYSILVRTTDGDGLVFEEAFTITVTSVNETPTDISLSNGAVAENLASGATVGTFSTTDPDGGAFLPLGVPVFTYTLVGGDGSTDNASFSISGDQLQTAAAFNFEAKSSYSIRVRSADAGSLYVEKAFTITITNVNETPTDIGLSPSGVAENQPSGTTVGSLSTTDPDVGDIFSYLLVAGTGDTDNSLFTIDGSTVKTAAAFNFEAKSSYSIRVKTTDSGAMTFEKVLPITVSDANEAPTDISLSGSSVAENQPVGTVVGTLSTTDPDAGSSFSYSLVTGPGDTDNGSFTITANSLKTAAVFNLEAKSTYSILVQTSDGTFPYAKVFTITVTNVNEAPTDISLSGSSIAENLAIGSVVGTFSTTDPDGGAFISIAPAFTYALVAGTGSTDNGSFTIVGSTLQTAATFNFEARSSYSIRVRSEDMGALGFEKAFTITVTNVNEAPTDISLSSTSVAENQPIGTTVGALSTSDPDTGGSFTYSLVAGTGDTDNASFTITGNSLKTGAMFDAETRSSYSIRIRTTDGGALWFEEAFTISISPVNEPPTNLALSASSVAEHQPSGIAVGALSTTDPDADDAFSYSLVAGTGDTDNASFSILGSSLNTAAAFNFETKASYSIRVRTTDSGAAWFEKALTITVTNVNEAPTDISLSAASVAENQPSGTVVGTFSTTDPDDSAAPASIGPVFTYTLVAGTGDGDNAAFTIDGLSLKTASVFDLETKSTYSIRVRTTDAGSLTFEEIFSITVTGANDAPTDIALSAASVAENQAAGTTVGMLSSTDQDAGDTFTYSLVAGTGDADNVAFSIDGDALKTAAAFDFEARSSYSIRLQTSDGALTFEKAFTITVTNINEAPTISDVANQSIVINGATAALPVTIGDPETPAADLTLAGTSSSQALVPDANVVIGGSGANRTVTVTPLTGQIGTATITLTVGDGELTALDTFVLTVGIGEPPKVTLQPGSQTITEGRNATFSADGTSAPAPTVHWEVSTNRGKTWTDLTDGVGGVSGAGTETLFITGVTREMSGYRYRAVFINLNGTVASDAATLTVKSIPTTKPTRIGTTLALATDANPSTDGAVTLTATVTPMSGTGIPTGTVTFVEGQVTLGAIALVDGVASLPLSADLALRGGEHEIGARYSGDAGYNPSTSGILHQVVGTTTTDLAVTMTGAAATPLGGLPTITWTIKVWNLGDEVASGIQVRMTMDKATKLVEVRADAGVTWVTKGRSTTVLIAELAAGATTTIEIDAVLGRLPRTDVVIAGEVTVSTASLDMNPSNDTSTASVPIAAPLLAGATGETSLAIVTETPAPTSMPRRRRRVFRTLRRGAASPVRGRACGADYRLGAGAFR